MNVLLVDDQVRILSGLISGLDWAALGVTGIRTASSAQAAKTILLQEHVDILLCDIEMPGENGLSLLRWARQQGQDFVCVFLTSHADFLYAKEAIQLGSFDYILQPARYDEIQATIARAITRVKNDNAEKELLHYGLMAKNQESVLFQNPVQRLDWRAATFHPGGAIYPGEVGKEIGRRKPLFSPLGALVALESRALAYPNMGLCLEQHPHRSLSKGGSGGFAIHHR